MVNWAKKQQTIVLKWFSWIDNIESQIYLFFPIDIMCLKKITKALKCRGVFQEYKTEKRQFVII